MVDIKKNENFKDLSYILIMIRTIALVVLLLSIENKVIYAILAVSIIVFLIVWTVDNTVDRNEAMYEVLSLAVKNHNKRLGGQETINQLNTSVKGYKGAVVELHRQGLLHFEVESEGKYTMSEVIAIQYHDYGYVFIQKEDRAIIDVKDLYFTFNLSYSFDPENSRTPLFQDIAERSFKLIQKKQKLEKEKQKLEKERQRLEKERQRLEKERQRLEKKRKEAGLDQM